VAPASPRAPAGVARPSAGQAEWHWCFRAMHEMVGSSLPLALYGFALGWSVAWPPGPINAEIVRRGLARGFWAACGLGLGAASGDSVWAAAVALGAGALVDFTRLRLMLSVVSSALLLLLAALFLRSAARGLAAWRRGGGTQMPGRFEGRAAGYVLGIGLALSSPWNVAFWLAVMGAPDTLAAGLAGALVLAGAVLAGTITWVLLLSTAVALLGLRFQSPLWNLAASGASALLMLFFAARGIGRVLIG
jgi:threonine/homoserine/homoserine lactone efflux protein